jgi:hypothetical protein
VAGGGEIRDAAARGLGLDAVDQRGVGFRSQCDDGHFPLPVLDIRPEMFKEVSRSAGQMVGFGEVADQVWLVSFMDYDLGFFDQEQGRVELALNPFAPEKVLTVSSE